jgi:divalent metal cation (Fe/Co/Zn/Cd) transporter
MRAFVLYTLARLVLFGAAFGLIWLVFGRWLTWDSVSALYTAIIALVVSSLVALFSLRRLRDDFAVHVAERADRAKAAYDAMRAAEDDDPPPA